MMTKEERQEKIWWLSRYWILENKIERLGVKRQHFINKMYKITTVPTGMPRGNTSCGYADILSEIDEFTREIAETISEQVKLCKTIEKAISRITDERLKLLLEYRYMDCLKWEEICVNINYSWRQVHYMHNKALNNIEIERLH